jgi:hypothetical protein
MKDCDIIPVKTWKEIIASSATIEQSFFGMGHKALLRNLLNLIEKTSIPHSLIAQRLLYTFEFGRQAPVVYIDAISMIESYECVDIENMLKICFSESKKINA